MQILFFIARELRLKINLLQKFEHKHFYVENCNSQIVVFRLLQNAACYGMGESDDVTSNDEDSSLSTSANIGASASICYGRNMTFPCQGSSYSHRQELPAIVTEGENYRLNEVSYDTYNTERETHRKFYLYRNCVFGFYFISF